MGLAWGAYDLSGSGALKIMDCYAKTRQEDRLTTSVLEIPLLEYRRFNGVFVPNVSFSNIAPNLGILCKESIRGAVLLRQGNFLACSYVGELTPNLIIYEYFLAMIDDAKNSTNRGV